MKTTTTLSLTATALLGFASVTLATEEPIDGESLAATLPQVAKLAPQRTANDSPDAGAYLDQNQIPFENYFVPKSRQTSADEGPDAGDTLRIPQVDNRHQRRRTTSNDTPSVGIESESGRKDTCFADVDGNGYIDFDDLYSILRHWGTCSPFGSEQCTGDLNGDGYVDFDDLADVLSNLGQRCR